METHFLYGRYHSEYLEWFHNGEPGGISAISESRTSVKPQATRIADTVYIQSVPL
jgi:hypothetical protein